MCDKFDDATFYDARGRETLLVQDPEEEIGEYFSGWRGQELIAKIAEDCPLTVHAMTPLVITEEMVAHCASLAMERAAEALLDDYEWYWDPDLGGPVLSGDDTAAATAAVAEILRALFAKITVWGCEVVATRDYSADEVSAILLRDHPDWFGGVRERG